MKCNLSGAEILTVGQLFELNCTAESSEVADLNPEAIELRLEEKDKYSLKIIKLEKLTDKDIKWTLTSYKTGEHDLKAVQIVSGDKSFVLGDLKFSVNSVIKKEEPVTEPYPSQGPLGVHLPIWYWVAGGAVLLLIIAQIFWRIRQRAQKKKLLQDMQIDSMAQDPLAQFFQSSRKMQRQYSFFSGGEIEEKNVIQFVDELSKAYKLYLARLFRVPTYFWSDRKILSGIKKSHRSMYQELKFSLRKALSELSRAQKASGKMSAQDSMQLFELIRKQVDLAESVRKSQEQRKEA